jgi:hypothetical protein
MRIGTPESIEPVGVFADRRVVEGEEVIRSERLAHVVLGLVLGHRLGLEQEAILGVIAQRHVQLVARAFGDAGAAAVRIPGGDLEEVAPGGGEFVVQQVVPEQRASRVERVEEPRPLGNQLRTPDLAIQADAAAPLERIVQVEAVVDVERYRGRRDLSAALPHLGRDFEAVEVRTVAGTEDREVRVERRA